MGGDCCGVLSLSINGLWNSHIYNSNTSQAEVFIAKIDGSGDWQWANTATGNGDDAAYDIAINSNGLISVVGIYNEQIQFGSHSLSSTTESQNFVSFISSENGSWVGATNLEADLVQITGVSSFQNGDFAIVGQFSGSMTLGSTNLQSGNGQQDVFVSRIGSDGNWVWAVSAEGNGGDCAYDVTTGSNDKIVVVGHFRSTSIMFGNYYLYNTNSWEPDWDMYVAWLDSTGEWQGVIGATGNEMDKLKSVDIHSNGAVYVTGRTNSTSLSIGLDERSTSGYDDMFVALLDLDSDGDEIGDGRDSFPNDSTQQSDSDNDGYGDNPWGTTEIVVQKIIHNGKMLMEMVIATIQMGSVQTCALMIIINGKTMTEMDIVMMAGGTTPTNSHMIQHNGKILMEMGMETTHRATTEMTFHRTQPNLEIQMETVMETRKAETTQMHSKMSHPNGKILTMMDMVITQTELMVTVAREQDRVKGDM